LYLRELFILFLSSTFYASQNIKNRQGRRRIGVIETRKQREKRKKKRIKKKIIKRTKKRYISSEGILEKIVIVKREGKWWLYRLLESESGDLRPTRPRHFK